MPNRILLVDDEELFLNSLKEGLSDFSHEFETDICFSVNEAIKHLETRNYDLVVTDIRLPKKTGIELLIYLKDIHFAGKVMVMSAYSTDESSKKIKSLGVVDIIAKPFKLEWFKNLILKQLKKTKQRTVTFESIDLVTVMQIINMEQKTSALQIDIDDKIGTIYFIEGEIRHAEYDGLVGEDAVSKLITLDEGIISVKNIKGKVKRTVEIPFVQYLMNMMKIIDESRRDRKTRLEQPKKMKKKSKIVKNKEEAMAIEEILKTLKEVNGYLGAGIFTPQGEILGGSTEISGIHFEEAGSVIHDTLSNSKSVSKNVGFGSLDMLQLYSEMGIIFAKCYDDGKLHFHTILVIKNDGNVAMAKLKLNKTVEALKEVM
jgi:DNA-binding response OmpR family regulator